MITYVAGDLFQSPAKVLVNAVNIVGVMGRGIAGDFKRIYPDMFGKYQSLCEKGQFQVGQLWLYKTSHKWILNFPTKHHWRDRSRPEYIELGLKKFAATYAEKGITSISFPKLGCGNGQLKWETQVQPLMEYYLSPLPITIFIHLFDKNDLVPEHRDVESVRAWLHGEPRALPFTEFWEDLTKLLESKHQFKTLDTATPFTVSVDEKRDGIEIRSADTPPIFIPRGDDGFLDLWRHIRVAGYCEPDKFPLGLDSYAAFIVSILTQLAYVTPIRLSSKDDQMQIGIQLIPPLEKLQNRSEQTTTNVVKLT